MTAVYLVAAIAALIWGTVFVLRGSLVSACLVVLVAAACFGHNFLNFDLGPVPMTLDRLAMGLLLVAYVVGRRLGRTDPKPLGRVDLLMLLFLGVLVLSGCMGGWVENPVGIEGRCNPLFRLGAGYLIPFALYWIARQSPLDRSKVSLAQAVLAGLGIYLAVTGLLEISGQWWAVFPKHIADRNLGIHFGRARGPMVHSVRFGLCLGVCMLAAWVWGTRRGRVGQLLTVALMPVMLGALYFSYTRSVWIGAGLGLMVVLGLTLRGVWRPLVLGTMVSAALLVGVSQMDQLVSFQREQSAADTGKSVDMRKSFAYVSWRMFLDRPLLGFGFGRFPEAKLPYLSDRSTDLQLESIRPYVHHNAFLSVLTETGLIGLVLYVAVLIGWGHAAWTVWRRPAVPDWARSQGVLMLGVLAVYVCQGAFHELTYSPIENSLLFLLAGITVGLRPRTQSQAVPARARPDALLLCGRRGLAPSPR